MMAKIGQLSFLIAQLSFLETRRTVRFVQEKTNHPPEQQKTALLPCRKNRNCSDCSELFRTRTPGLTRIDPD
jgi:hypothetical protein